MVFKLSESAQKRWKKLRGFSYLIDVMEGIKFIDGKREGENEEIYLINAKVAA